MATTATDVTQRLTDYALSLGFQDIPQPVIRRAQELFLDFLGVALGGRATESTQPIVDAARDLAGGATGPCTVLGDAPTYPAHFAALLNGTLAHSMDFDDTHAGSIMHIGTPVFATLLALAEERGATGADFLTAAVVGYDVAGKLGNAHRDGVHLRGFHPTATTGIFGATAAGARLLGLTQEQLLNALGLNLSQSSGSQQFLENGAWTKRLHVGLAAHNAVYSLAFARRGFKGPSRPLEGRFGYFALYSQDGNNLEEAVAGLGHRFEVMATAVKPYPCCRYSHGSIDAVLDLMRRHNLRHHDIAAIDLYLPPAGYAMVGTPEAAKRRPSNVVEGQFSAFFAAAYAAVKGVYGWSAYQSLTDPEVLKLAQRVNVRRQPDFTGFRSRVVITGASGLRAELDVKEPKGEPENPLSWDETTDKFRGLAGGVIGPRRAEAVIAAVDALPRLPSLKELTQHLRGF